MKRGRKSTHPHSRAAFVAYYAFFRKSMGSIPTNSIHFFSQATMSVSTADVIVGKYFGSSLVFSLSWEKAMLNT